MNLNHSPDTNTLEIRKKGVGGRGGNDGTEQMMLQINTEMDKTKSTYSKLHSSGPMETGFLQIFSIGLWNVERAGRHRETDEQAQTLPLLCTGH